MMTCLYLGLLLFAVFAAAGAGENKDIHVICEKDSVKILWKIRAELVPYAARFFLGNCMPSRFTTLPTGEGVVEFNYLFADCKFKRVLKGKYVSFENELTYRPQAKPKPADYAYPIKCSQRRPTKWSPPFLNPGSGTSVGRGGLVFKMALLSDDLKSVAKTNIIPQGSFMPVWAAVEQKSHQQLLLLMDECVVAATPELQPESPRYTIISNKGCLLESVHGNSMFLPRYHWSALILKLQAFDFGLGAQVYLHCKLTVWDPSLQSESKKACQYSKATASWELLDDPMQSFLCGCCNSVCKSRFKRGADMESQGLSHTSVLGPLIIVDQSAPTAYNMTDSIPATATNQVQLMED